MKKGIVFALIILAVGISISASQFFRNHEPTAPMLIAPPKKSEPKSKNSAEVTRISAELYKFDPKNEKSLLEAVSWVKTHPSDDALYAFRVYSESWLNRRISELDDTSLSNGRDSCTEFAESKPEYNLMADNFDDVCTLSFDAGYMQEDFFDSATEVGRGYLKIMKDWREANFDFNANANLIIECEQWFDKTPEDNILRDDVQNTYSIALGKVFQGVVEGFMPLTDDNNKISNDAFASWVILFKTSHGRSQRIASELLELADKSNHVLTEEISRRIETLLRD